MRLRPAVIAMCACNLADSQYRLGEILEYLPWQLYSSAGKAHAILQRCALPRVSLNPPVLQLNPATLFWLFIIWVSIVFSDFCQTFRPDN